MKSRQTIILLIPALLVVSLTWALRDRLQSFVVIKDSDSSAPRMIDGGMPSEDIRHSFESADKRFSEEKNWRKRELDASGYPFTADEFMRCFEKISPEGALSITCSYRNGDGQILSVSYPDRLSEDIELALRAMSRRTNGEANKEEHPPAGRDSD